MLFAHARFCFRYRSRTYGTVRYGTVWDDQRGRGRGRSRSICPEGKGRGTRDESQAWLATQLGLSARLMTRMVGGRTGIDDIDDGIVCCFGRVLGIFSIVQVGLDQPRTTTEYPFGYQGRLISVMDCQALSLPISMYVLNVPIPIPSLQPTNQPQTAQNLNLGPKNTNPTATAQSPQIQRYSMILPHQPSPSLIRLNKPIFLLADCRPLTLESRPARARSR